MNDPIKGLIDVQKSRGLPPLEKWDPPYCGEIDIRISRDGNWHYLKSPIGRPELVKLFASILWLENDEYFLKTPVEKVKITVDDAPFLAVDFEQIDGHLHFKTKTDDKMIAGPKHPIKISFDERGEASPYILVRRNLWALIDRKSYYRLIEIGDVDGDMFGIRSGKIFFPIIKASMLETG